MTNLTVSVQFTQSGGAPATGLALADIDIYLTRQNVSTGVADVVWTAQNPTVEIDNIGAYIRILAGADLSTYNYYAYGQYTGASVLDNDYSYGSVSGAVVTEIEDNVISANSIAAAAVTKIQAGLLTLSDLLSTAIETGLTFKNAMRAISASTAGKLSGSGTGVIRIRNAVADDKDRITSSYDANNNRVVVTYDFTD